MNFTPYAVDHQSVTRFMSRNIEFVILLRYLKEKTFGEAVIWPDKDTGCVHFYFARTPLSRLFFSGYNVGLQRVRIIVPFSSDTEGQM